MPDLHNDRGRSARLTERGAPLLGCVMRYTGQESDRACEHQDAAIIP